MQSGVYLSFLTASGLATIFLALFAWKNSRIKGAPVLAVVFLLGALWIGAGIKDLLSSSLQDKIICANLQFISYAFLPVFWLWLVLLYLGYSRRFEIIKMLLLMVIPLATVVLAWTNDYHYLIRTNIFLEEINGFSFIASGYGPWFWVHVAYSYGLNLITILLLIVSSIQGKKPKRRQSISLLAGIMITLLANLSYILYDFLFPKSGIPDYTPIAFGCSAIIIGVSILRDKLFNLAPIAREELFDTMNTGVIVLDELDRIVDMNRAASNIFGVEGKNVLRQSIKKLLVDWRERVYSKETGEHLKWEMNMEVDGEQYCYELDLSNLFDRKHNLIGRLVVLYDITERKRSEELLSYTANHDSLTGLVNRQHFKEISEFILKPDGEIPALCALLYLDLDNFKQVNDLYGHEVGDALLQETAVKMKEVLREKDTAARIGGDEFAILLADLKSEEEALQIAERLLHSFGEPVKINGISLKVTLSIGISFYPSDAQEIDALIKKADIAMYWVKNKGRNGFITYKNLENGVSYENFVL